MNRQVQLLCNLCGHDCISLQSIRVYYQNHSAIISTLSSSFLPFSYFTLVVNALPSSYGLKCSKVPLFSCLCSFLWLKKNLVEHLYLYKPNNTCLHTFIRFRARKVTQLDSVILTQLHFFHTSSFFSFVFFAE